MVDLTRALSLFDPIGAYQEGRKFADDRALRSALTNLNVGPDGSYDSNAVAKALFGAGQFGPGMAALESAQKAAREKASTAALTGALGGLFGGGMGSGGAAPQASTGAPDATRYQSAISGIESGGRYDAMGPVTRTGDRAYGKYQVMGANIPQWTQAALGRSMTPEEFLADQKAQDATFNHRFGQYAAKYGPEGAARAWFAGEGGMNDPNRKDILGTSVSSYAQKFNNALGGVQPPASQPATQVAQAGNALSPAQQQQLQFARGLVANPDTRAQGLAIIAQLLNREAKDPLDTEKKRLEVEQLRKKVNDPDETPDQRELAQVNRERTSQGLKPFRLDEYKLEKAKAGSSQINVGGGSEKQFFDAMEESTKAARAAAVGLNGLREARKAIDGGAITGFAADQRLALQKIGALLGADPAKVTNTETFRAAIAPQVAAVMKATVGSTQISNADREFAERAAGGSITLDQTSITRLLDIMERASTAVIAEHNDRLDRIYPGSGKFERERAIFGLPAQPQPVQAAPQGGFQRRPGSPDPLGLF